MRPQSKLDSVMLTFRAEIRFEDLDKNSPAVSRICKLARLKRSTVLQLSKIVKINVKTKMVTIIRFGLVLVTKVHTLPLRHRVV